MIRTNEELVDARGVWLPGKRNFFCRYCSGWTNAEKDQPDPDRCATPNCARPYGFGSKVPMNARP
jgi:hypothetical protein